MRRAERQRASRRSRLSLHASGEFRLELREVLLTPLLVFVVHLVRVPLPAVEDAAEFGLVVERIHELAVHDPAAEVPRAAELVHEIGLVRVQVVDGLGEQRDELGLRLPEGEMPAAVQIRHSVQFGVPERFPVVFLVPGDDVPVEPPVVALCLPARVVHARTDRRELDRATHHLAGAIPEAAEEIENHAPVAVVVFEAVAFRVVPGVEVAVVDAVFPEVRVGLVGVTGRTVALLNDLLHPVAKPPGKGERGDDAADLVLRVVVLVVAVRGVVSVGHDAVADHQQVSLNPYEYVAVDVFNHILWGLARFERRFESLCRGVRNAADFVLVERLTVLRSDDASGHAGVLERHSHSSAMPVSGSVLISHSSSFCFARTISSRNWMRNSSAVSMSKVISASSPANPNRRATNA